MTVNESYALKKAKENTDKTVAELHELNEKMDKQIELLEMIIVLLRRREDDGK